MAEQTGEPEASSYISKLIGGFLIDLAKAQHMSNEYSKRLGEIYKKDPLLRVFPVPNGCINSVNMELKADIQGIGLVSDPPEAVLEHAYTVFDEYVEAILGSVLPKVADALRANRSKFDSPEKAERMAGALGQPGWRRALAQEVQEQVRSQMSRMVSAQGELNEEAAARILGDALIEAAVEHPDYSPLPEAARGELRTVIRESVNDAGRMKNLRLHLADRPAFSEPSLRVSTASSNVSALGPELVGRLDLQAGVRDYIVQSQSTAAAGEAGMPPIVVFRLVPAKH